MAYTSSVRPIFEFAAAAFHTLLTEAHSDSLERLKRASLKTNFGHNKLYIDCLQEAGFETLKQRREKIFKDFARKTYDSEMFGNKRYQEKEPSSYALRNERNKQEQHTNVCIIPPYRNQINDETQGAVQ